jgi:biopolymer transport protein ExbB
MILRSLGMALAFAAQVGAQTVGESLDAAVARLDAELAAESQAAQSERQAWAAELSQARTERSQLAEQLLAAQVRLAQLTARRQTLEEDARQAAVQARDAATARITAQSAAATSSEQLTIHLTEVPGQDAAAQAIRPLAGRFRQSIPDADSITALITGWTEALDGAMTVDVRDASIHDSNGKLVNVKLLSIGRAAYAWREPSGPGVGLAMRSPADAAGYRWSQTLPRPIAEALRQAITQQEAGASLVMMPLDVTGRMQADSIGVDHDWVTSIRSGGPVMIPLGLVAAASMLLLLERSFVLFVLNRVQGGAARRVIAAARSGDLDQARRIASGAGGAALRVLAACLRRQPAGQHAMEDSIQEQLMLETPRLQRFLGGMAVLAAASPLLGLLGTVTGIIQTFNAIYSMGTTNPAAMAGGISEALVTTAAGLIIAIPTLLAHSFLRGRVDRIVAEAENQAATLLNVLAHDHASSTG